MGKYEVNTEIHGGSRQGSIGAAGTGQLVEVPSEEVPANAGHRT